MHNRRKPSEQLRQSRKCTTKSLILSKNFKEDLYNQETLAHTGMRATRLDVSYERRKAQFLEKENAGVNARTMKSPTKRSLERIDENRYQRG